MKNVNIQRDKTKNNQVILNSIQDLQRLPLQLVNNVRGRSRIKYGMTALFNNNGGFTLIEWVGQALPDNAPHKGHFAAFTLIELLVVVLIIGILAAVAVPQYQKAIIKTRLNNLLYVLPSIKQAQEAYYLANGHYSVDFAELSLSVPGTTHPSFKKQIVYSPGSWSVNINDSGLGVEGHDERISEVKIYFFFDHVSSSLVRRKACYAKISNEQANNICQHLSGSEKPYTTGGISENIYIW